MHTRLPRASSRVGEIEKRARAVVARPSRFTRHFAMAALTSYSRTTGRKFGSSGYGSARAREA